MEDMAIQENKKPRYTALYKKCDISKSFKEGEIQSLVGNNKRKMHQVLNTITRCGEPYVWAIRDDVTGIFVEGGTTSRTIGKSFLWDEKRINEIALRFFDITRKKHKRSKRTQGA